MAASLILEEKRLSEEEGRPRRIKVSFHSIWTHLLSMPTLPLHRTRSSSLAGRQ